MKSPSFSHYGVVKPSMPPKLGMQIGLTKKRRKISYPQKRACARESCPLEIGEANQSESLKGRSQGFFDFATFF